MCTTPDTVSNHEAAVSRMIFNAQEHAAVHNPYAHEQRKLACIRHGNESGLIACQQEVWSGQIGKVADDPLRQEKNIAIIVIVLASRAAIDGGLPSELGFTLADTCICSIEAMTDLASVQQAIRAYELDFAGAWQRFRLTQPEMPMLTGPRHGLPLICMNLCQQRKSLPIPVSPAGICRNCSANMKGLLFKPIFDGKGCGRQSICCVFLTCPSVKLPPVLHSPVKVISVPHSVKRLV